MDPCNRFLVSTTQFIKTIAIINVCQRKWKLYVHCWCLPELGNGIYVTPLSDHDDFYCTNPQRASCPKHHWVTAIHFFPLQSLEKPHISQWTHWFCCCFYYHYCYFPFLPLCWEVPQSFSDPSTSPTMTCLEENLQPVIPCLSSCSWEHKLGMGHGRRFRALLYGRLSQRGVNAACFCRATNCTCTVPRGAGQREASKLRPIQCAIAIKGFLSAESGVTSPLHQPINAHILYLSRFCFASKTQQKWGDVKLFTEKKCIKDSFALISHTDKRSHFLWFTKKKKNSKLFLGEKPTK